MDFNLTKEQEKFKQEVCEFLDREVTEGVIQESESGLGLGSHSRQLMRNLGAKGWLAPSFPKEYGGLGLSHMYRYIIRDELDYRNALTFISGGLGLVGTEIAGPTILRYGSEELKREFLPRIARGEIEFALGFTEPEAGSDLSRIAMRAIRQGDEYVISGQKIFNTACHFAQYHWLCARTDPDAPRHRGLSMFVVDLKTPGITIKPLWEMSGTRTNEVFYDEVRVSERYLVGEENRGWYYMASALDLERLMTVGGLQRIFYHLVDFVKSNSRKGMPLSKDPLVRQRLVEMAIELSVARNLAQKVVWLQDKGVIPAYEGASLKLFVTEFLQRLSSVALQILGLLGQLREDSKYSVLKGEIERFYRGSFVVTIGGGSSEIMRTIIALRGLGLPR